MAHRGSAVGPEVGADTEVGATAAVEATQLPETKPGKIGGTAGLVEASAAAAASRTSDGGGYYGENEHGRDRQSRERYSHWEDRGGGGSGYGGGYATGYGGGAGGRGGRGRRN